jgi:hypothetical protein
MHMRCISSTTRLTLARIAHVAAWSGVLSIHRDKARRLCTTHTLDFLCLSQWSVWHRHIRHLHRHVRHRDLPLRCGSFVPTNTLSPSPKFFSGGCLYGQYNVWCLITSRSSLPAITTGDAGLGRRGASLPTQLYVPR